jgi:hypothetical protein
VREVGQLPIGSSGVTIVVAMIPRQRNFYPRNLILPAKLADKLLLETVGLLAGSSEGIVRCNAAP